MCWCNSISAYVVNVEPRADRCLKGGKKLASQAPSKVFTKCVTTVQYYSTTVVTVCSSTISDTCYHKTISTRQNHETEWSNHTPLRCCFVLVGLRVTRYKTLGRDAGVESHHVRTYSRSSLELLLFQRLVQFKSHPPFSPRGDPRYFITTVHVCVPV